MRYSPLLAVLIGLSSSIPVLAQDASGAGGAAASPSTGQVSRTSAVGQQSVENSTISNAAAPNGNGAPQKDGEVKAAERPIASIGANDQKEKNEFQDFVNFSTGRNLPLFGYALFGGAPSTFAPVDRIPVTADYVLGPGDEIVVRAWGQVDMDFRATVDRNGEFYIPRVGNINVAGIKYQELQGYLKTAIGRVFRNFDLNVNLGQLRSIQIFVVGQARRPGSYTVSSLSTLVNALFASGGPSGKGSMRRIQLKRDNKVVTEFDVYDLLIKGDKSRDVRLLPGDVIYIPSIGPLIAIAGGVNNPAVYEIKDKPNLEQAIALAGGLTTTAAVDKVTLERIANRKTRVVEEFKFDPAGLARTIDDGDLITILSISPRFDNAVTLRGNVAAAARYPWKNGMRIKDLIPEKSALITPDYWTKKNAATLTPINGQAKLQNDAKYAISEVNWDYAVIERLNTADLTTSLIPFNLGKVVLDNDPVANLPLLAGDVVTIFSKGDIRVPSAKQAKYVMLEGEINHAGVYRAEVGETLRDMASRVGEVTPDAYLYGAEFTRESTRVLQQKKLDEVLERMERDNERVTTSRSINALSQEDAQSLKIEAESRKALIARLRQIRATGRIALELQPESSAKDLPDIVLEDGDRLVIPSRPVVVNVIGSVYTENSFLYKADKQVADYLAQAGGFTKDADEDRAYVLKADGSVLSKRQSGWFGRFGGEYLMPGDSIIVPEKIEKTSWAKDFKDWSQILANFGLGAAAIKVLKP